MLVELLRQGATQNGGFFNTSYGSGRDEIFGLLMCYVDHSWDDCVTCLNAAPAWVGAGCPYSRSVSVNYDRCLLRYSNQSFGATDQLCGLPAWIISTNLELDAVDAARMNDARWALVGELTDQAANSPLRFAHNSSSYMDSKGISLQLYALAQCRWDLVHDECTKCLGVLRNEVVVVVVVADIYLAYLSLLLSLTCNLFYFVQHQSGAASNHLGGSLGSRVWSSQHGPSP